METIRIRDPGWEKVGSGITSRIRNTDETHRKIKKERERDESDTSECLRNLLWAQKSVF
jgi:hypothetical protein